MVPDVTDAVPRGCGIRYKDDGSVWRFYFHQGTGPGRGDACVLAIRIWRGVCGYSFLADRMVVSPPIWFGKAVPRCAEVRPYIITSDTDNARMWFDFVRTAFVRNSMTDIGFGDDDTCGGRDVGCVVSSEDGTFTVDVWRRSFGRETVQAVWTVGPGTFRCSYRYPDRGDEPIVVDPGMRRIPTIEAWSVLADTLSLFFDNMLSRNMSLSRPAGGSE